MSGKGRPLKADMLRAAVIAGLSDTAFRLFVSMSLLANEDGVFRADPDFLHAEVYWLATPTIDLEAALRELAKVVEFFDVDGISCGRIRPKAPARKSTRIAKAPAPDGYSAVIDAYHRAFLKARGVKPVICERTGKAAKDLLRAMSTPEAIACIEAAFDDRWFAEHAGALWQISQNPNRFRVAPPAPLPVYRGPTLVKPVAAPPSVDGSMLGGPSPTDPFPTDEGDLDIADILSSRCLHG